MEEPRPEQLQSLHTDPGDSSPCSKNPSVRERLGNAEGGNKLLNSEVV